MDDADSLAGLSASLVEPPVRRSGEPVEKVASSAQLGYCECLNVRNPAFRRRLGE